MQYALPALLALAHRARLLLVIILVAALGGGLAYALLAAKTYRASVVLSVVAEGEGGISALLGQFGGLASLAGAGGLSVGKSSSIEPIAVLSSREFARGFIQDNALLPELFHEKWDSAGVRWKVRKPSDVLTLEAGVKRFVERVRSVEVDELGGLVTLTVDWRDREVAANWANAMVARVNRELRQRAIAESQNSINYLNAEAAKTNVQPLLDAIYRVIETQVKAIMLAKVRDDYAFKVIDPAVPSDADRHVWPRGSLVMGLSLIIAMVLSVLAVLGVHLLDQLKSGYKESIGLRE